MNTTSRRWVALVAAGVLAAAICLWLTVRQRTESGSDQLSSPEPARQTSPDKPQPEIVRAPHTAPGERTASPGASGGAAQVLPEAIEAGTADVAPEKLVRLTPARRKQLNQGLSTRASAPAIQPETATARVTTPDNNTYSLTPNQVSNFERVYVSARDVVNAEVT